MSVSELIGDYQAFFNAQRLRLEGLGVDVSGYVVSHLAYRAATTEEYYVIRDGLEKVSRANVESVWNGRPVSKLLLSQPLELGGGFETSMLELIPPVHKKKYKLGLEHAAIVIGEAVDEFSQRHFRILNGQPSNGKTCEPYFRRFDDDRSVVKFLRISLLDQCVEEGQRFDGFYHAGNDVNTDEQESGREFISQ